MFGRGTAEQQIIVGQLITAFWLQPIQSVLSDSVSTINSTCPVNELPPEILTRCFLYLTPYFPLTLGPEEPEHDWIRVAHVCKRWRAIAFGFSGLWDWVEFTRPEIFDMYMREDRVGRGRDTSDQ